MRRFGTDGIRGKADEFNKEFIEIIAKAIYGFADVKKFVIGRDTRESGEFIASTLTKALVSRGAEVVNVGITPSPVLAFLTTKVAGDTGVMISASHNPPDYNGIKLFGKDGGKLSERSEKAIEALMASNGCENNAFPGRNVFIDGDALYIRGITEKFAPYLKGKKILLDTANGAAFRVAPAVFESLGAEVAAINTESDGKNINNGCGATHPENALALSTDYDIAFSYDGDADRVMAIKNGRIIDGDLIIYIIASYLAERGALPENTVVATVMSNIGIEKSLYKKGIKMIRTPVGDRNVAEAMRKYGAVIGGEASGHIILSDFENTGDGILTSVFLARIDAEEGLFKYMDAVEIYPQYEADILTDAEGIARFTKDGSLGDEIEKIKRKINGRIVVRPSGTEPKIRIMAEAPDRREAKLYAEAVKSLVASALS